MRARIKVVGYDGSVQESEGVFAGWGDQVAFERRFGVNAAVLSRIGSSFTAEGSLADDADPAAIKSEWLAFLAFRVLVRGPAAGQSFDEWLEGVADLDITTLDDPDELEAAEPDPTIATVEARPIS